MKSKNILEIYQKYVEYENYIQESTISTGSGSFRAPLRPGLRLWDKNILEPFVEPITGYENAEVYVDSLDGNIETKGAKRKEEMSKKIANYDKKHPVMNDDDGDVLNRVTTSKKIKNNISKPFVNEINTSTTSGPYTGPVEIGLKKWSKSELGPFTDDSDYHTTDNAKKKNLKNNIKKIVGMWEKHPENGYEIPTHEVDTINEDLAVWFGKKKKPKGSKQPKGPWVNICKKVDGKHPPCGRPDTSKGAYPKCRAAGVAGKMSDSSKRAACQQKRKAEKKDTQTGKGQKPIMTSYKPKKKKTNESVLINLIRKALD